MLYVFEKTFFLKFPRLYPLDRLCRVTLKVGRVTERLWNDGDRGTAQYWEKCVSLHGTRNVFS